MPSKINLSLTFAVFAAAPGDVSLVFIELGAAVIGLAVLARLAHRFGFSAIPLYLLGGLAFGNGVYCRCNSARSSFTSGPRLVSFSCFSCLVWNTRGRNCEPTSVLASPLVS
jgi:hypothetical protein